MTKELRWFDNGEGPYVIDEKYVYVDDARMTVAAAIEFLNRFPSDWLVKTAEDEDLPDHVWIGVERPGE